MIGDWKWRYLDNLGPSLAYHRSGHKPFSDEVARVLSELNQNGVATTSARRLLGEDSCYNDLSEAIDSLERDSGDQIAAARKAANGPDGWKNYLIELLGKHPPLDPDSVYSRFALQPRILRIVSAYFGMFTRLRLYNVWHNFACEATPRNSQLWHRDPEDRYVLKVFVYHSDVDEGSGPFTFAIGSHSKGGLKRQPAYSRTQEDRARRSTDAQMAEVVPPERWKIATGPKGTMVLADTRGYHKGGFAKGRDRVLYMCMFASQASRYPELFDRPRKLSLPLGLNREQIFALSARREEVRRAADRQPER